MDNMVRLLFEDYLRREYMLFKGMTVEEVSKASTRRPKNTKRNSTTIRIIIKSPKAKARTALRIGKLWIRKSQDILEFVKNMKLRTLPINLYQAATQAVVSSREDKDYIGNINSEGLFNETKAEENLRQHKFKKKKLDFI